MLGDVCWLPWQIVRGRRQPAALTIRLTGISRAGLRLPEIAEGTSVDRVSKAPIEGEPGWFHDGRHLALHLVEGLARVRAIKIQHDSQLGSLPDRHRRDPRGQFRAFHGALKNADLVAQRENPVGAVAPLPFNKNTRGSRISNPVQSDSMGIAYWNYLGSCRPLRSFDGSGASAPQL